MALSSAAVLTVYAAGYLRTRSAAQRLEATERPRIVIPSTPAAGTPVAATSVAEAKPPAASPPVAAAAPATPERARPAATPAATAAAPRPKKAKAPAPAKAEVAEPKVAAPDATASLTTAAPATGAAAVTATASPVTEPPPPTQPPPPPPQPQSQWKDGTYTGWGTSRHGDIQAAVVIEGGKIVSATIAQCWTRYSCSWIAHLQGQVVQRQSPEVDWVTGATQSVNAFYYAVVEALSKAK